MMDCEPATAPGAAADKALGLRDEALAALDEGNPQGALGLICQALAALESAGLRGGLDECAVLIAHAEIEEALDRFAEARGTIAAALTILPDAVAADADQESLMLWCQAQERLAGLERLACDFTGAATRLRTVLERASAGLGEASLAVASAANALGVVYKNASDLDRRGSRLPAGRRRRGGPGRPGSALRGGALA